MAPTLGLTTSSSPSSSLPTPTNARGNPRRPPKLRSSCDACGAAKVRCDKTQPRCGRCAAGGLTCVYGLSRKFGKAPRKKPPVETSISTETLPRPLVAQQQSAHHHQHQHHQHQPHQHHQHQQSLSCCPDFRQLSSSASTTSRPIKYEPVPVNSGFGIEDNLMAMPGVYATSSHDHLFLRSPTAMDGFDDPFAFSDATCTPTSATFGPDPRGGTVDPLDLTFPTSAASSSPDYASFADWGVHPDDLMHSPPQGGSPSSSSHHSEFDTSSAPPSLTSSSRTSSLDCSLHFGHHSGGGGFHPETTMLAAAADAHNCHRLAYATLEGLSFRHESPALAKGEPLTQTMDAVLCRNKQAVANMHQLLRCACSKSPHLAMLYASITSKILMWYQLAAGCSTRPAAASWDYFSASLGGGGFGLQQTQPTPPLSASSSPSLAFVQPPTSSGAAAHANTSSSSSSSPVITQTNQFVVTPMQFSVGAFSVDDESAQEALRRQLLLSELKKAGNLIDLLSVQGRDELATGEVNDIYSALGTWLKCELNRTIAFLKS